MRARPREAGHGLGGEPLLSPIGGCRQAAVYHGIRPRLCLGNSACFSSADLLQAAVDHVEYSSFGEDCHVLIFCPQLCIAQKLGVK